MLRATPALLLVALAAGAPSAHAAGACPIPGDSVFGDAFERSSGRSVYVATTGSNTADGSWGAPWRTIQHAVDHAAAGDAICVRGGVYNEVVTLTRSGSATAGSLVLQRQPGESVRIDGTGLAVPNGQWGLVTLVDVSHVAVRGFEIANFTTTSSARVPIGVYVTGAGTSLAIAGNRIHHIRNTATGCAANAFGLKVDGTRGDASINQLVIAGNELHDLVLGCSESLSLDGNVEHWRITGNIVRDTNNIAIGAIGFENIAPVPAVDQARDGLIDGNTVYNVSSFGNSAYGNIYAAGGIYVDGGTRITIERNLIHHVDLGIEVASEHAGRTSSDVIVRNNLVHSGYSAGISIGGYDASVGGSTRVTIVNNTLYRNDSASTGSGEFQIQFHATSNTFANNLVFAGPQGLLVNAFTGDTAAPAGLDHNLYFGSGSAREWVWRGTSYASLAAWRTGSGQDAHGLAANPLFVDTVVPDLRVAAGSPAIDAGTNPGASIVGAVDFAGSARVQGAAIDIGAYER